MAGEQWDGFFEKGRKTINQSVEQGNRDARNKKERQARAKRRAERPSKKPSLGEKIMGILRSDGDAEDKLTQIDSMGRAGEAKRNRRR